MPLLSPAADAARAAWIVAALRDFAVSVVSLVPRGFPAYVRVFHPASLGGQPVTWAAIAPASDRRAHPIWEGFDGMRADVKAAPAFSVPQRRYHLMSGPLEALGESAMDSFLNQCSLGVRPGSDTGVRSARRSARSRNASWTAWAHSMRCPTSGV